MRRGLLCGLLVAAFCGGVSYDDGVSSTTPVATSLETGIWAQINDERRRRGLVGLRRSRGLEAAAAQHSREMASLGYFGHSSRDGTPVVARIARYYPDRGFGTWSCGETLLWWSPWIDPADVVRRWLRSPSHRAQLLDARFREIGVAVVRSPRTPGIYGGRETTIVTADFGVRR